MLVAEYSYERDIQVKQQEAKEEGMLLTARIFQLIKSSPDITNIQAAEQLGCTPENVENVRKMFEI